MRGCALLSGEHELGGVAPTLPLPGHDVETAGQTGGADAIAGTETEHGTAGCVVDQGLEGELAQVVGTEVEALALRVVGQGIVRVGLPWRGDAVRGCNAVHDVQRPEAVVARGVACIVGVAQDGGAVVRASASQVGGVVAQAVVQVDASARLRHEQPLLRLVGRVGRGDAELCAQVSGGRGGGLRGVGQSQSAHPVDDVAVAVGEGRDLPLLAVAVVARLVGHDESLTVGVEAGARAGVGYGVEIVGARLHGRLDDGLLDVRAVRMTLGEGREQCRHAHVYEAPEVVDIFAVGAVDDHLAQGALPYVPALIVQALRRIEQGGQAVNAVDELLLEAVVIEGGVAFEDEPLEPLVLPHAPDPLLQAVVGEGDVGHQLTLRVVAAVLQPVVVVEGDVIVPHRSEAQSVVVLLLIEEHAPEVVGVGGDLAGQIPADERECVDVVVIAAVGLEGAVQEAALEGVDEVAYVVILLRRYFVVRRVMDGDGHALDGSAPTALAVSEVGEAVGLEEVAAGVVALGGEGIVLLPDVYAMAAHVDVVAHLIVAAVLSVQGQVSELGAGREHLSAEVAHAAGQGIAEERLVAVVGQEGPLLGVGPSGAQEALLLWELDAIGLLRHVPGGVAPSADEDGVVVGLAVALKNPHPGGHLRRLAADVAAAVGLDIDMWQAGQPLPAGVLGHESECGGCEGQQCECKSFQVLKVLFADKITKNQAKSFTSGVNMCYFDIIPPKNCKAPTCNLQAGASQEKYIWSGIMPRSARYDGPT